MGNTPIEARRPTELQARLAKRLCPHLRDELLPYGFYSNIAREVGVTPAYVSQMFVRLKGSGGE